MEDKLKQFALFFCAAALLISALLLLVFQTVDRKHIDERLDRIEKKMR